MSASVLVCTSVIGWLLGLAALALAMERHYAQLQHHWCGRLPRLALRIAAIVLIASSLGCAVISLGVALGLLLWLGLLTPSALVVAGVISYLTALSRRLP